MDSVTVSTPESVGSRIGGSIAGMLLGGVLFLASFALLWWNEGNVIAERNALDEMRKTLVKADANAPKPTNEGKLVHASGKLVSKDKLGDEPYLKAGPYLKVERRVYMYQWVEEQKTSGSGSTKKKTYTYEKKWSAGREDSETFHQTAGHENPPLSVQETTHQVASATFGKMDGLAVVENIDAETELKPTAAMVGKGGVANDAYVYLATNKGKPGQPQIGDVRIAYEVVKPGTYSVIARQVGKSYAKHHAKNGKENFLVEAGNKPPAAMIQSAKEAAGTIAMILRVVGFIVMFVGMNLLAGPISTLLSFIPFIGGAGRFLLTGVLFVAAAVLSTITILVSMVAHHPILLAIVVIGTVAGLVVARQKKKAAAGDFTSARPQVEARAAVPQNRGKAA